MQYNKETIKEINKKETIKRIRILSLLFIAISILGIGYAIPTKDMSLTGKVNAKGENRIIITDASVYDSSDPQTVSVGSTNYNNTSLKSYVTMSDQSSTVSYKIIVTNFSDTNYGLLNISGLPDNMTYTLTNYNLKDKICDDTKCNNGASKEIIVTISYKSGEFDSNNISHNLDLSFDFRKFHSITYSNITNNNYPEEIIDTGDLNVTFVNDIPIDVYIEGSTDYTYTSPNLIVNNITEDITIKKIVTGYKVTYIASNGTFDNGTSTNIVTYNNGNVVAGEYMQPEYESISFKNWYTTETFDDGTEFYIDKYIGGDITVYAKATPDRASFNIRSVYRQLHDGQFSDGTRYKSAIEYLKRADELPDWMKDTNWWNLGTKTKVVDEYQWLYGNNGVDGGNLPIVFWMDMTNNTLYWYSEDGHPKVTLTDQYGKTSFFDSFSSAIDLSGASYWDVSELTYFNGICYGCSKITNLDFLKHWDVSNATTMDKSFAYMTSLEDASGIEDWDISNVTSFNEMFRNTTTRPTFSRVPGTFQSNGTYVPN